jgi:hypothetical protein
MLRLDEAKIQAQFGKTKREFDIPEDHDWQRFVKEGQYPRITRNFLRFRIQDPKKYTSFVAVKEGQKLITIGKTSENIWEVQSVGFKRGTDLSKETWIKVDTKQFGYFDRPEIDIEYIKTLRAKIKSKLTLFKAGRISEAATKEFIKKFYKGDVDKLLMTLKLNKTPNYDSIINVIIGDYAEEVVSKNLLGAKLYPIISNYYKIEKGLDITNYKILVERVGQKLGKTDIVIKLESLNGKQVLDKELNISVKTTSSGEIKLGQIRTNTSNIDKQSFLTRNLRKLLLGQNDEIDIIVINNKFLHAKKFYDILPKESEKYKIKTRDHKGYLIVELIVRPGAYIGKRLPELN